MVYVAILAQSRQIKMTSFRDTAYRFGSASAMLSRDDSDPASRFTELLKSYMKDRAIRLAETHSGPVLYTYCGDGTPIKSVVHILKQIADKRFVRQGGE